MDSRILGGGKFGDVYQHWVVSALQFELSDGLFHVRVYAPAGGVNPHAVAVARYGEFGGLVDDDKFIVLGAGEQLADVEVDVALRAPLGGVQRDTPIVA